MVISFTYSGIISHVIIELSPIVYMIQINNIVMLHLQYFYFFRFIAVIYPLKQRITKTRVRLVIALIWILAICIALAQLVVGRATQSFYAGEYYDQCSEQWASDVHRNIYTVLLFLFTYLIPLVILTLTYYKIGLILWQRRIPGHSYALRDQMRVNSRRKVS